jgi:dephospho-CoA kinase
MTEKTARRGIVLGLIGPVCAGKSEVSRRLRELGAEIYDADAVVRELYARPDVKDAVRELFGDAIFESDGSVNRAAIAERVFSDGELRRRLTTEILFPRTGERLRTQLAEFRARAAAGDVLVLDAPTLLEAGRAALCDAVLFVTAPVERRRAWAHARGWAPDELRRRDAAMAPEDEKRRIANFVIENTGSVADLRTAVDAVWQSLRRD